MGVVVEELLSRGHHVTGAYYASANINHENYTGRLSNKFVTFLNLFILFQGYIFWPFLSKLKNREEFEGGLEKRKGKGETRIKKKRVIKHMFKYLYEA